jgi:hypothetical protein
MTPIAPRVQSVGGTTDIEEARNGLSSSSGDATCNFLEPRGFPSHSHNQQRRLRSSVSKDVVKPEYVVSEMLFKTFRTIPWSGVGEIAQVASAWERACCSAV